MRLVMHLVMQFALCKNEMYSKGYAFGYAFILFFFVFHTYKLPKWGRKYRFFVCFRVPK